VAVESLLTNAEADASVCILETVGRTSGQPRRLEIWFAAVGPTVYLLAGGRDRAHWVRNLRANSSARLRIGSRWIAGRARELDGGPEDLRARDAVATKYRLTRGGSYEGWLRTSLAVAIDLSK
jgi:deazaflavin-dependent oxidoreductase (nitroreductase family)